MNITQLELNNFQKHEHLLLDFTKGVNVIVGATDCGKSTVIRAIRWIFYPDQLRGEVVRKTGSKKTSVKVILDSGTIIERIKTSTVNSYKLTVKGEEKEYNATGGTLPSDIQDIIKFIPVEIDQTKIILNIANQIAMPFLLDVSGTFRQKLFNKLTGNDILDQAMQGLNKDILQVGRDEKSVTQQVEELSSSLGNIKKQREIAENLSILFGKQVNEIKILNDKLATLTELQVSLNKVNNQLFETKKSISLIKSIPEEIIKSIKLNIIKFDNYLTIQKEINKVNNELKIVNKSLSTIKIPNIDIKKFINDSLRLEKLIKWKENLTCVNNSLQLCKPKIEDCNKIIIKKELEKKELLKNIKICPFHNVECPLNKEIK